MSSTWRYGKRSKYHTKVSQDPEEYYRLDAKKSAAENAYDIYSALCCRDTRDTKRLFLLNALATLCQQQQEQQQKQTIASAMMLSKAAGVIGSGFHANSIGFTTEELLYCLSASLIHSFTQVRAAALRTMRYAITTPKDVNIFNSLQLHHLVCRSIDIMLKNDDERVQALKLVSKLKCGSLESVVLFDHQMPSASIRKMLAISPTDVSPVLVRCLISLADSGAEDNDNMLRACLATLCELAVLNPMLLIVCGGVTTITRNILECHNPRIAESLCGVLLYLLEWPQTRNIAGIRLDCLAAPYCDFTYRLGIMDKNKDARELRYTSCRLALLSVLRSWTGTLEFCDPSKPSGLKSIVDSLYLNQVEVRKAILDLLYQLLGLPQPTWTDDYMVALQAVDPSDFQDNWLLSNGFVAMEGRSILPSLASRAPNVCEQHLSLLLYCFLETGLLNALVEVIVGEDITLSVSSTVLIGKILHLMHTHLPADICSTSPALPTLVMHATQGDRHATAAVTALQSYQKMLRSRPAACSLFLDSIIQSGALAQTRLFRREISSQDQNPMSQLQQQQQQQIQINSIAGTVDRQRLDSVSSSENESASQSSSSHRSSFRLKRLLPFLENLRVVRLMKESNVLTLSDRLSWDWEVVITILRSRLIRKLDDTTGKFLKRLVHFFKPSSNSFSHQDLVHGSAVPPYVIAGLDLLDWLLASRELESMRILTDYFSDISSHLHAVTTSNRAHDCLFSPQHMSNTMCQQYFLYIGRMCRTQKGISILNNTAVFQHLINLVCKTDHVCYVKLIVSGLDYGTDSVTRKVLEKALTSAKTRSGRLYATQFLVVLLRARIPNFEVWGIPLIIQQTKDPDRAVVLAAMDVLEEACHEKYYLEEIVRSWPNLKCLGDVGRLLMARYYSIPRGLNHQRAKIKEEIEYWKNGYNKRYVLLVESDTHSSLTLHVRNEEGYYSRRNCNTRPLVIPPNISPHLYGQMAQTTQGTTSLRKYADLSHLIEIINRGKCNDDVDCLELKAAIWAVGHTSTHSNGIEYLTELCPRIYERLIILATKCDVFSIRATCFSVLGLIGGTIAGANILFKLNWLSVRHDRNTIFPVHQPEDWMSGNHTPVRHHFEDMPPYNYTGVEDQIDGYYFTGSYWNLPPSSSSTTKEGFASASSEAHDINTTVDSNKTGVTISDGVALPDDLHPKISATPSAKSKTLPESNYMRHNRHQRSLSESKTTDVISLIANNVSGSHHYQHRIRYNSCTDSNTSGVSSCESVTGNINRAGANVGDFQQFPLSPIPSMSNLVELPPRKAKMLSRTSLLGTTYDSNTLSPMDMKGYAQFRSLRRHCRPVLSESSAELYDFIDCNELVSSLSFRPRKSSFGESTRRLKVRSLDRQFSLRMMTQMNSEEMHVPLPTLIAPKFFSQNDSKGPNYAGICLPKNLLDLFPPRKRTHSYVLSDIQDQDFVDINLYTAKQQFLNDSLNNDVAVVGAGDESSVISSLSDVSSASKRSKWLGAKHGRSSCIQCSRARRYRNQQRSDSNSVAACELYTNATAALVAAGLNATAALARKSIKTATQQQHKQSNTMQTESSSTVQLSDISFNSPESILSDDSLPDKVTAHILYNVQRLANPVSAKQSKMALLESKQKHPNSFQDVCLYSEVCKTMGRSSYRMNARRLLQELFLDLNLESFYNEPTEILSRKDKDFTPFERAEAAAIAAAAAMEIRLSGDLIGGVRLPTTADGSSAISCSSGVAGGHGTHKPHLKSQPLASVYETSCENLLLEQSPRLQDLKDVVGAKGGGMGNDISPNGGKSWNPNKISPSQIKPRHIRSYQNELRITSSDEEEDGGGDTDYHAKKPSHLNTSLCYDQVDSFTSLPLPRDNTNSQNAPGTFNSTLINVTTPTQFSNSSFNVASSSNCSDQTSNSNRSSICTISHHPVNVSLMQSNPMNTIGNSSTIKTKTNSELSNSTIPIENENKKYTRGRFYTLELDLSCTKNKFPIRDRSRISNNSTTQQSVHVSPTSATTTTTTNPNTIATNAPSTVGTTLLNSPTRNAYIVNSSLQRQASLGATTKVGHSPRIMRQSSETTNSTQQKNDSASNTTGSASNIGYYTITKSLAASLAKPIGSLYCEKRLQSARSEALLTNVTSIVTTSPIAVTTSTSSAKASSSVASASACLNQISKQA